MMIQIILINITHSYILYKMINLILPISTNCPGHKHFVLSDVICNVLVLKLGVNCEGCVVQGVCLFMVFK